MSRRLVIPRSSFAGLEFFLGALVSLASVIDAILESGAITWMAAILSGGGGMAVKLIAVLLPRCVHARVAYVARLRGTPAGIGGGYVLVGMRVNVVFCVRVTHAIKVVAFHHGDYLRHLGVLLKKLVGTAMG